MQRAHFPASLFVLAGGMFAVGMDAFVVAAFTSQMAVDLHTTAAMAGQSATVFSLAYALLAPVMATITAAMDTRRVLCCSLLVLAAANLGSALAPTLGSLLLTRVVAAAAAGSFSPAAAATAVALVDASRKGRALAIVIGGLSVSTAIGVPIGHALSLATSWRAALVLVGALCLACAAAVAIRVARLPAPAPSSRLSVRLAPLRLRSVRRVLVLTTLGMAAAYSPYAFIVPIALSRGVTAHLATAMLSVYGCGAVFGNWICGVASDRVPPLRVLRAAYAGLAATFAALIFSATQASWNAMLLLPLVFLWGACSWAQSPAQLKRLVSAAPHSGSVVIALNASSVYAGMAVGAAVGGLALARMPLLPFGCGILFAACALSLSYFGAVDARPSR